MTNPQRNKLRALIADRVATLRACADVLYDTDFQGLLPQGAQDKIGLQQKADNFTKDWDDFFDRYGKLRMA